MKWITRIIFVVAWLLWAIVAYKLLLPLEPPPQSDLIEEAFTPSDTQVTWL